MIPSLIRLLEKDSPIGLHDTWITVFRPVLKGPQASRTAKPLDLGLECVMMLAGGPNMKKEQFANCLADLIVKELVRQKGDEPKIDLQYIDMQGIVADALKSFESNSGCKIEIKT